MKVSKSGTCTDLFICNTEDMLSMCEVLVSTRPAHTQAIQQTANIHTGHKLVVPFVASLRLTST